MPLNHRETVITVTSTIGSLIGTSVAWRDNSSTLGFMTRTLIGTLGGMALGSVIADATAPEQEQETRTPGDAPDIDTLVDFSQQPAQQAQDAAQVAQLDKFSPFRFVRV